MRNEKKQELISNEEFAYLIYCLIEGVSKVSNTAGVYGAFLKHWDKRAHNKIQILPVSKNLFDESNTQVSLETHCAKIEYIISEINCDILYLAPLIPKINMVLNTIFLKH